MTHVSTSLRYFPTLKIMRSDRTCPTRELNFTPAHWRKWRYLLNTFRSSPMQRLLFPDLFLNGSIALALTYYNEVYAVSHGMVQMSLSGFTGVTTAIGLLAGFRLNASYGPWTRST